MVELAQRDGIAAKALAFAILTAARSGEVRGMTWGEVDDDASVWTVPGGRMKAGKEHRVPLTPAARALLGERGEPDALVFPSPTDAGKPLSDMTLMAVLRRMGRGDLTVARLPLDLPRLGRRDDGAPARGDRGGAGAPAQGQGRGRLCPRRPVREAAQADGGLGGLSQSGRRHGGRVSDLSEMQFAKRSRAPDGWSRLVADDAPGFSCASSILGVEVQKLMEVVERSGGFRDAKARRRFGPELRPCIRLDMSPRRSFPAVRTQTKTQPDKWRSGAPQSCPSSKEMRAALRMLSKKFEAARVASRKLARAWAEMDAFTYGAVGPSLTLPDGSTCTRSVDLFAHQQEEL